MKRPLWIFLLFLGIILAWIVNARAATTVAPRAIVQSWPDAGAGTNQGMVLTWTGDNWAASNGVAGAAALSGGTNIVTSTNGATVTASLSDPTVVNGFNANNAIVTNLFGNLANSTNYPAPFITAVLDPGDPNARSLMAGTGIALADNGPGSTMTISVNLFVNATNNDITIYSGNTGNLTVGANTTVYSAPGQCGTNYSTSDTSAFTRSISPVALSLGPLTALLSGNPGAFANSITVMTNGTATPITIPLNNVSSGSDTSDTVIIPAGVEYGVKIISAASSTPVKWSWGLGAHQVLAPAVSSTELADTFVIGGTADLNTHTTTTGGYAWAKASSSGVINDVTTANNAQDQATASTSLYYVNHTISSANYTATVTMSYANQTDAVEGDLAVRYDGTSDVGAANSYFVDWVPSVSGGIVGLCKVVAGTATVLGSASGINGTSHTMKISVNGSTVSGYYDGILIASVTDTTFASAGKVGIGGGFHGSIGSTGRGGKVGSNSMTYSSLTVTVP